MRNCSLDQNDNVDCKNPSLQPTAMSAIFIAKEDIYVKIEKKTDIVCVLSSVVYLKRHDINAAKQQQCGRIPSWLMH